LIADLSRAGGLSAGVARCSANSKILWELPEARNLKWRKVLTAHDNGMAAIGDQKVRHQRFLHFLFNQAQFLYGNLGGNLAGIFFIICPAFCY